MDKALEQDPLTWKGYSHAKRITLDRFADALSKPIEDLDQISFCRESLAIVRKASLEDRLRLQHALLDSVDHSAVLSPFMGVMAAPTFNSLKADLELYMRGAFYLVQALASEGSDGEMIRSLLEEMPSAKATGFSQALSTSRHNYTAFSQKHAYKDILNQPLFIEMGVDILANASEYRLSEFQVRYTTPYPHLLASMNQGYQQAFPQLFQSNKLALDGFPSRRNELIKEAYHRYSQVTQSTPTKLLIDAWGYLENPGANWKKLAHDLGMEYALFDDLQISDNPYERKYRKDQTLFVFNQPALHLLDPGENFFKCINNEKLEEYDELGWQGLMRRYLDGKVFLAHPPTTDILNDKALYDYLPLVCSLLYGRQPDLSPVESWQLWNENDSTRLNEDVVSMALQNKDSYVIAHRYLEGGMGIRVGASTSMNEWKSFLETFVADHPYLYVLRQFFPMHPDLSLRSLGAGLATSYSSPPEQISFSDSLFARFSLSKPLTSENSSCFLIFRQG